MYKLNEEMSNMNIFKVFGSDISYNDYIQLDGAFSVAHVNYGNSPIFNGVDSKDIAKESRKDSLSSKEHIEDVLGCLRSFNGTEKDFNEDDKIDLWEIYWLEYINAFDKLTETLPNSVVTIYIGRQATEIGMKYLLMKNGSEIPKTHNLKILIDLLYSELSITDKYMEDISFFCEAFCKYIEGGNVEYFRFPEYRGNNYFAGNNLAINWLSYNLALILLKLLHLAELENKFHTL